MTDLVTVSCPKCHVPNLTLPEQNGVRKCDQCGAYFEMRTFPIDQDPSGVVWATTERKLPPIPAPSFPAVVDSPSIADPSFATAGEALKAARDEYSDGLAAHVPPKYKRTSRLRHWWESKKGEWRRAIRDWLGVTEVHLMAVSDGGTLEAHQFVLTMLRKNLDELVETAKVLRQDFDAATQANVDIFRNYDHRITLTEGNVERLRGQFVATEHQHGRMLKAFRTVPMNGVAWRKFCEQEQIDAKRKQKKVAGAIAPSVKQGCECHGAEPCPAAHQPTSEVVAAEPLAEAVHESPHSD